MTHRDEERNRRDFEDERDFDPATGRSYTRDWGRPGRDLDEERYGYRGRFTGYGGQDYSRDWERSSGRRFGDAYGSARGRYGRGEETGTYGRSSYTFQDWPDDRDAWRGQDYDYRRGNWRSGRARDYGRGPSYGSRSGSSMDIPPDWQYDEEDDYSPSAWTYYEYWFIPGPYVGEGPQGYQRSDERIREDVSDRLTWHGQINASDIQVDVSDGEVTLRGSVDSRYDKRLAEDIADSVMGVRDVHNQLRVRQPGRQWGSGEQSQFERRGGMQSKRINGGEIRRDMEVVGKGGKTIGRVKEIRQNDFLVDRDMERDVFVPFSACHQVDDRVTLNVAADQVDQQGWQMPELVDMGKNS